MKQWKKPISVLSAGLLLSGALFAAPVDAAKGTKKVDATYNNIKIVNNGKSVTIDPKVEPFIYNNSTYIPLRMMGELYNKNVAWNGATATITITDKAPQVDSAVINQLTTQIATKNAEIEKLKKELNDLKTKIDDEDNKDVDLDDLEDDLNDEYGDYRYIDDVRILILFGDEDEVELEIEVNASDWDDLDEDEQLDFLQDIIDDILDVDEFEDAEIYGEVVDEDDGDTLEEFETDSRGKVDFIDEGNRLEDLEDDLNDDYGDYRYLDDIEITLDGDKDDIDIDIEVNEDDWEALSKSKKLEFLQDIIDDILREFDDAYISGIILDADDGKTRLNTFDADGEDDGEVTLKN